MTDEERIKLLVELTTAILILIREIRELSERLGKKQNEKPRNNRKKPRKRKR